MIRFIERILFPRLSHDQAKRELQNYLLAAIFGLAFAGVITVMVLQKYYQR